MAFARVAMTFFCYGLAKALWRKLTRRGAYLHILVQVQARPPFPFSISPLRMVRGANLHRGISYVFGET